MVVHGSQVPINYSWKGSQLIVQTCVVQVTQIMSPSRLSTTWFVAQMTVHRMTEKIVHKKTQQSYE